jgi:small multidrug resistance pump
MVYLMMASAIASEVLATSTLPRTDGFTRLWPSVVVLLGYGLSFVLMAQVVKTLPVGIVYAIWSAVGTLAVVLIGAVFLDQRVTVWQALGVALVIAGVVLLHGGGSSLRA